MKQESAAIPSPVLFQWGPKLEAAHTAQLMAYYGLRHEGEQRFSYLESARKYQDRRLEWLMGSDALLRVPNEIRVRRMWARPLNWLIRTCRVEVEIPPGCAITVEEMLAKTKGCSGLISAHIRKLLKNRSPQDVFTVEDFHAAMIVPEANDI